MLQMSHQLLLLLTNTGKISEPLIKQNAELTKYRCNKYCGFFFKRLGKIKDLNWTDDHWIYKTTQPKKKLLNLLSFEIILFNLW